LNLRNRGKNKEESEKDIPEKYKDFKDRLFNKAIFDQLLDQSKWDHAIKLIPNVKKLQSIPIKCPRTGKT